MPGSLNAPTVPDRGAPGQLTVRPERPPTAGRRDPVAGQRPQRLRLIAVGRQDPEAVAVGPGELGEHETVKAI